MPPTSMRDEDDDPPAQAQQQQQQQQQANAELKERLRHVQRQRKEARRQAMVYEAEAAQLLVAIEVARAAQQQLVDQCRSADRHLETVSTHLRRAQSWNVLASDAYHIDQEMASTTKPMNNHNNAAVASSAANGTATTKTTTSNTRNSCHIMIGTINGLRLAAPTYATGSWKEVNSAFGYVALLLSQLERHVTMMMIAAAAAGGDLNNGNSSTTTSTSVRLRYAVQAAGGTSKIGLRNHSSTTNNSSSNVVAVLTSSSSYNLFWAEDTFQFFSKRNFNTALGYLLGHVQDLTRLLSQQWDDSTTTLAITTPLYEINEVARTIGGVSLVWIDETTSATDFTRALRYLLTNMKHLMGHAVWGVLLQEGECCRHNNCRQ
jgi:Apg6 BARA domain